MTEVTVTELELKRKQLLKLEAQGKQAMDTSDMPTARLCQKRYRDTEQELKRLVEQRAKRAHLAPADSGGGV